MTEERLKVLEILQEGKISADDAAQLLEAITKTAAEENTEAQRVVKVRIQKSGDSCCSEEQDEECCSDSAKGVGVVCVENEKED